MENGQPSQIKKLLFTVMKLTKKDMEKQLNKAGIGISHLQFMVLVVLAKGMVTLNEIAKKFDIKPPTLIPVVDALEKGGFLLREHDKSDRRKIQLKITPAGLTLVKKNPYGSKKNALNQAFSRLSAIKQKRLTEDLQELADNFLK